MREVAHRISSAIKREVPEARWLESYVLIGRYDFLDIFDLPTPGHAQRLEIAVRAVGRADAEVIPVLTALRDPEGNLLQTVTGGDSSPREPRRVNDSVAEASLESFPASDAPAWTRDRERS